jgi:uncharacterized protein YaaQ
MLFEKRSMTPFLIGVLETDEDELLSVLQSVCKFGDCLMSLRTISEIRAVPLFKFYFVPSRIMGAFVTHPLHFDVLLAAVFR